MRKHYSDRLYSVDRIVDIACNKRRPDFVIDAGTHFIVIECDEHQHRRVDCETVRMWQIRQALGLHTTFVRYNPDSYRLRSGNHGVAALDTREKTLVKWVDHLISHPPATALEAVYLYYDGWTRSEDVTREDIPHPVFSKPQFHNAVVQPPAAAQKCTDDELAEYLDSMLL